MKFELKEWEGGKWTISPIGSKSQYMNYDRYQIKPELIIYHGYSGVPSSACFTKREDALYCLADWRRVNQPISTEEV